METDPIPFETFASFERLTADQPLLYVEPPAWAAAAHAIVIGEYVHYLWAEKKAENFWVHMHSWTPIDDPTAVRHDPRNPILEPSAAGFDSRDVEYPFPFHNPADGRCYMYYLGQQEEPRCKQTGLLVSDGDLGSWTRVCAEPVVVRGGAHEESGCSHPSVAVDGKAIHMVYTGERPAPPERRQILYNVPTICHATAPVSDPARVTKNPANAADGAPPQSTPTLQLVVSKTPFFAQRAPPLSSTGWPLPNKGAPKAALPEDNGPSTRPNRLTQNLKRPL